MKWSLSSSLKWSQTCSWSLSRAELAPEIALAYNGSTTINTLPFYAIF